MSSTEPREWLTLLWLRSLFSMFRLVAMSMRTFVSAFRSRHHRRVPCPARLSSSSRSHILRSSKGRR